jgi:toxin ParE1/3/4
MRVRWTRLALADLRGIRTYIAADNPRSADAMVERLRAAAEMLMQFPLAGRAGDVLGTRELVVARTSYILVYRIERSGVSIARVLHGAQDRPE